MNKEMFINRVADSLKENRGTIFVGSGISHKSVNVCWDDLIKRLSPDLGIELVDENENLPLIAQYIVNEFSGNRGPLIRELHRIFNKDFKINNYHKYLALTNISTIWTTNYDTLLEKTFSDFNVDVKVNESGISKNKPDKEIEIIKLHGCIERSEYSDIVVTEEDYEDFFINKPAISQRLSDDFVKKSFLFIGYSYRDPNIKKIMIQARRLTKGVTQEHYLILKKEVCSKSKIKRQELWCNNLKRLGFLTLFINNHDELEEILKKISQKSRGNTIYITGSHEYSDEFIANLGRYLAEDKSIILVSGQSAGVGATAVASFIEKCIEIKSDINSRLKMYPNPYASNPKYSNSRVLLEDLKKCRAKLFNSTQIVIVFAGGIGTEAEIEVAKNRGCKIIPVILKNEEFKNDSIQKILRDEIIMNELKLNDFDYFNKIKKSEIIGLEDVKICLMKMLEK